MTTLSHSAEAREQKETQAALWAIENQENKEVIQMTTLSHSAEGTHWTKKNHKYIRKEGNRYIYPSDANRLRGASAVNRQASPDYKTMSQQKANRSAAASGKVVNPSFALRDSEGRRLGTIHTKGSFPTATTRDFQRYSGGMAQRGKVSRQASPDYRSVSQNHASAMAKERNDRKSLNELKRSNAIYNQNTPNYGARSKQHAAVTNQASPDYRSVSENNANANKRRNAVNNQASPNYRVNSSRRAALNRQGSSDYRSVSENHANAMSNDRKRRNAVNSQSTPNYRAESSQRAALNRQGSSDYRSVSENHANSMRRGRAVSGQGSTDYRALGSDSSRTNKTKRQLQAKNRQRALNSQGGSQRDQDFAKRNYSGGKWINEHRVGDDGRYGSNGDWESTHTHSSAGAKRQGFLNRAKSGSQRQRDRGAEIVKEVRDNYTTVNKIKSKGKKAVDALRNRFRKRK